MIDLSRTSIHEPYSRRTRRARWPGSAWFAGQPDPWPLGHRLPCEHLLIHWNSGGQLVRPSGFICRTNDGLALGALRLLVAESACAGLAVGSRQSANRPRKSQLEESITHFART